MCATLYLPPTVAVKNKCKVTMGLRALCVACGASEVTLHPFLTGRVGPHAAGSVPSPHSRPLSKASAL
eukprot:9488570-Pyramimonas_sp.AAC.1